MTDADADEEDDAPGAPDDDAPLPAPGADEIENELSRLREANLMLAEAMEHVREDNRRLLEDLLALRENMRQLQEALSVREEDAPGGGGALLPPLVPRDFEEPAAP